MRNCTRCKGNSPDNSSVCLHCGADLTVHSSTAQALAQLRQNPRVGVIRVIASADACPACQAADGEFNKDDAPALPVEGCSHPLSCRCFYEPMLTDLYP